MEDGEMMGNVTTVCYGEKIEWESREQAEKFSLRAMHGSEGSEQDRYTNILVKLQMEMDYCTDDGTLL